MRILGRGLRSAADLREKWEVMDDVRQAEKELRIAQWRFHEALGQDHVDYAVYSLEAAEKKLDMLLRKAKAIWSALPGNDESRGGIG